MKWRRCWHAAQRDLLEPQKDSSRQAGVSPWKGSWSWKATKSLRPLAALMDRKESQHFSRSGNRDFRDDERGNRVISSSGQRVNRENVILIVRRVKGSTN